MFVQAGVEACDDGNMVQTDACLNSCQAAKCGDGQVQAGVEQCDDGNIVDNDGCSNTCKLPVVKYTAVGPQVNVPAASLAGWTACYTGKFNENTPTVASVLAACTKANLMLACRPVGAANFTLLAHAPRVDVIKDTGQGNVVTVSNGSGWYFNNSWSWGFAKQGDAVARNSCDTQNVNPTLRQCWHTGGGNMNSGYRCGSNFLNGNAGWERVVLQAD